jgi:ADP-ribose pyrophosphatase YjhB (NUDIX family)
MQEDRRFNIRVYGLLIYNEQILLADEMIQGNEITKFPGGGLQWGEGPVDGLKREWQEETGLHIEVEQHFYTTEFFQLSAFDSRDQVISIYYRVEAADLRPLQMSTDEVADKDEEMFRWHPMNQFSPDDMTMPIDKQVSKMIQEKPMI